jgi:hypothetical protein
MTLDRFQAADNTPTFFIPMFLSSVAVFAFFSFTATSRPPHDNEQPRYAKSRETDTSPCHRHLLASRRLAAALRRCAPLCLHHVISL